jgi:hypothetical protein
VTVEAEQELELRRWAVVLSGDSMPERRAMGRAMQMLLGQIDSLRGELERERAAAEPVAAEPAAADAPEEGREEAPPAEDTTVVGLRDRLRAATHRGRG